MGDRRGAGLGMATVTVEPNSLDYDYKHGTTDAFEYTDHVKCALCEVVLSPSGGNAFLTHCPHCDVKWIKGHCDKRSLFTDAYEIQPDGILRQLPRLKGIVP